jgi:FtsZ-interacting cell division protein ZipA
MKNKLILAASVALALSGPAFAQDSYSTQLASQPAQPAQPAQAEQPTQSDNQPNQSAQTDQQANQTDQQTAQQDQQNQDQNEASSKQMTPVEKPVVNASRRHCPVSTITFADSVAPVISDTARQPVAANTYDPCKDALTKVYPTVDRGHVEGDPPTIDHSADIAPVTNQPNNVASVPSGG